MLREGVLMTKSKGEKGLKKGIYQDQEGVIYQSRIQIETSKGA